ncbi:hypothetical protein IKM_05924 [Bacillus mycoides]|nr:hypothetical protein IKM_05924 [Bacillus mycoides]
MKRKLLALVVPVMLLSGVGCANSGNNNGFVAGYI